jgi:hypothetical protein
MSKLSAPQIGGTSCHLGSVLRLPLSFDAVRPSCEGLDSRGHGGVGES